MGFKRGDKVIVTGVTLYGSFEGCEGVIIRDSQFHDWLVDVTFPDGSHDELGFDAHELAPQEPAPVSAAGDRDAELRNDLYGRVQEVLDLAAYYAPGELGEFPEKVAKTVADFKNYRNLADKQIQERDETITDLRAKLAAAEALAAVNAGLLANAQHELATRLRELVLLEGERNRLRGQVKTATETANDYRDQIWVHQGTLRVLKAWLSKADGFSAEDGLTEASILGMVTRDLEASEAMDTRTMIAANALAADGAEEAG
jgi:hypothetical protein